MNAHRDRPVPLPSGAARAFGTAQNGCVPDAMWQGAAGVVAVAHLAVVLFLVGGGFVVRRRRGLLWAHLAVVTTVVTVTVLGAPCPLTELELWLRELGGVEAYRGGYIEHYLVAPVYPPGLTLPVAVLVNTVAVATNVVAYLGIAARDQSGRLPSSHRVARRADARDSQAS
jgi:hypothetical protein